MSTKIGQSFFNLNFNNESSNTCYHYAIIMSSSQLGKPLWTLVPDLPPLASLFSSMLCRFFSLSGLFESYVLLRYEYVEIDIPQVRIIVRVKDEWMWMLPPAISDERLSNLRRNCSIVSLLSCTFLNWPIDRFVKYVGRKCNITSWIWIL